MPSLEVATRPSGRVVSPSLLPPGALHATARTHRRLAGAERNWDPSTTRVEEEEVVDRAGSLGDRTLSLGRGHVRVFDEHHRGHVAGVPR